MPDAGRLRLALHYGQRALPWLVATLLLLAAALYNGYPLTFWDTRAYLEHAYTLLPRPDRLIGYSVFIRATMLGGSLWSVAVAQCALVALLVLRVTRELTGRRSAWRDLSLVLALTLGTALPWIAGQLMADIFTPLLVLALFLLLQARSLSALERGALLLLVAACVAVHLTHLPLGLALLALSWLAARGQRGRMLRRLRAPAAALLAGALAIAGFNFARSGRLALAPGSDAFVLAHLVESGLASRVLDAHCPERDYLLCPHRARLPMSTDRFLWVDALHIAPWEHEQAIRHEAKRLLADSLREQPLLHAQVALTYTAKVLVRFASGEGLDSDARPLIEPHLTRLSPRDLPAYAAARQQADTIPVARLRALHTPLAALVLLAALALVLAAALPRHATLRAEPAVRFTAFALAAYVMNAALSANLSGIYDRYQSRLLWLLVVGIACVASPRVDRRDTRAS